MNQQAATILVTGATGNTGRAIVDALAERGAHVRAMVRTEADRSKLRDGVEAVIADFDETASIAAARPRSRHRIHVRVAEPVFPGPARVRRVDIGSGHVLCPDRRCRRSARWTCETSLRWLRSR
ncbi:MAG TPA: NAD(P)H-binding protein [Candidatus Dormibacteraeota bacterium]